VLGLSQQISKLPAESTVQENYFIAPDNESSGVSEKCVCEPNIMIRIQTHDLVNKKASDLTTMPRRKMLIIMDCKLRLFMYSRTRCFMKKIGNMLP